MIFNRRGMPTILTGLGRRFRADRSPSAVTPPPTGNSHSSARTRAEIANPQFPDWLRVVSSGWSWEAPHLRLLQTELDAVTAGTVDRLMLFLPPRHGKSELVTVRYPVYRLEQNPECRVLIGAYNQALAERFSRKGRRIAAQRFPLAKDRNAAAEWETPAGGGVRAVGVGSGVTGLGADLIVIDDPVKSREEAESAVYRDRVWDWYRDDLYTRQEPRCAIILVMTRWHEDDLAGRILRSDEGSSWRVVRLPALAESPAQYRAWGEMQSEEWRMHSAGCGDPSPDAGGSGNLHSSLSTLPFALSDPLGRSEGEALWPERFDEASLARIRATLGSRSFAALYQGRPLPAEGGLFKREWFQILDQLPGDESAPPTANSTADSSPSEPGGLPLPPAASSLAPQPPALPENSSSLERMRHARRVARGDYGPVPPLEPARDRAEQEYQDYRSRLVERFTFMRRDPASHDRTIRWVRFWDTAAKAGQRCDYWAGALVGKGRDGNWYLGGVVRGRWEYPEAKRRVLQTAAADGPDVPVAIEDSASGSALLQDLRCDRAADGYLIRAEKVAADKAVRAGAWASLAEAGRFYLLRGAWNGAFLEEVESFPYGAHDDQVDAVSGAHAYLFRTGRVPRVMAFAGRAR